MSLNAPVLLTVVCTDVAAGVYTVSVYRAEPRHSEKMWSNQVVPGFATYEDACEYARAPCGAAFTELCGNLYVNPLFYDGAYFGEAEYWHQLLVYFRTDAGAVFVTLDFAADTSNGEEAIVPHGGDFYKLLWDHAFLGNLTSVRKLLGDDSLSEKYRAAMSEALSLLMSELLTGEVAADDANAPLIPALAKEFATQ